MHCSSSCFRTETWNAQTALSGCRLLITRCPHRRVEPGTAEIHLFAVQTRALARNNVHRNLPGLMAAQHGI